MSRPVANPIATIETVGGTAVATVMIPALSSAGGIRQVESLLAQLDSMGAGNVVLDIENLQSIDTECMAALVASLNRRVEDGRHLALVSPDPTAQHVVLMTQLARKFPICRDMMSALAAVERPAREAG